MCECVVRMKQCEGLAGIVLRRTVFLLHTRCSWDRRRIQHGRKKRARIKLITQTALGTAYRMRSAWGANYSLKVAVKWWKRSITQPSKCSGLKRNASSVYRINCDSCQIWMSRKPCFEFFNFFLRYEIEPQYCRKVSDTISIETLFLHVYFTLTTLVSVEIKIIDFRCFGFWGVFFPPKLVTDNYLLSNGRCFWYINTTASLWDFTCRDGRIVAEWNEWQIN